MTELLTAAQMRAIEQAAIDSGAVTGLELMERAGQGVVEAVLEEWPELALTSHKAVVLCGPGNNGGDGFVVARLLKARGWDVEVFLYGEAERLPPDARVNYERWVEVGEVEISPETVEPALHDATVIFDAIFGIGLNRPIQNAALQLMFLQVSEYVAFGSLVSREQRIECSPVVVSIDIPSGVCSDSGKVLIATDFVKFPKNLAMPNAKADLTVTFHTMKPAHYFADGPYLSGKVKLVDLGLGSSFNLRNRVALASLFGIPLAEAPRSAQKLTQRLSFLTHWPIVERSLMAKWLGHKFSYGHALILSGPSGQGGAARLAARGAQRIGAGVVSIAAPPEAMAENAAQLNAIMLKPVADVGALAGILEDWRINALCIGPGFGTSVREVEILAEVLGVSLALPPDRTPEVRNECAPYGEGPTQSLQPSAVPGLTRDLDPDAQRGGSGAGGGAAHKRNLVLDADALTLLAQHPALFAALHENCILTPHAGEFARLFPDIAKKLAAPAIKGPAYSKVDATREAAARAGCVVLFKGPDTVIAAPDGRCAINSAHYDRAAPWLATAGSGDVLAGFITGLLARGFAPMAAAESAAWLHVECARQFGPGLIAEDIPEQLPAVFRALGVN